MDLAECSGPRPAHVPPRFIRFVDALTSVVDIAGHDEARVLHFATPHVQELVAQDDWLPEHLAVPISGAYGQYLLYRDPKVRFTVVSFVWDGGARTPIHDHKVWGIIGVLRGAEIAERFTYDGSALHSLGEATLAAGQIDRVSPRIGDIHQVRNAFDDRSSISIHVYGADLCTVERRIYCRETGRIDATVSKPFDNAEPLLVR
jgi:predicted metal-dependent enzyme (double-stranded beta helix superfamily)